MPALLYLSVWFSAIPPIQLPVMFAYAYAAISPFLALRPAPRLQSFLSEELSTILFPIYLCYSFILFSHAVLRPRLVSRFETFPKLLWPFY